ncbi:MAG: isoprenylcysteine carboxylmethyltransferase family protein [Elusimicrobia bacterium]|nr:isoprenylcysteine carboxylmethyltransferase family protein [Elusimicrobiota bacterium]
MNIIAAAVAAITVLGVVVEFVTHPKSRQQLGIPRGDWLSVLLILVPYASAGLLNLACWLRPPVKPDWALAACGFLLCLGCLFFRTWGKLVLGDYYTFSIDLRSDDHPVIDYGPYRLVRHPLYFGVLLGILGMPLLAHSWLALLIFSFPIGFVYGLRLLKEDRFLMDNMGEPYRIYARRTARLIPFVW